MNTSPEDQLRYGREALAISIDSDQPAAKRWEASIRNNIGYALHQLKRYDEALVEFKLAVPLREVQGNASSIRAAYWMVAWTLRAQGKLDDALAIQMRLERESRAANEPDPFVYEELELLWRGKGDEVRAQAARDQLRALRTAP